MSHPLYLCFLWHMHQPEYRDPLLGRKAVLPWVRFHGIKDYLDMVLLLNEFPSMHQTFNLVPCLIDQLESLATGEKDLYWEMTEKKADELSLEEKDFLLLNFFMAHWTHMVGKFPRYQELLEKRGKTITPAALRRAHHYFTLQDFLDLQCLSNLAWFDPSFQKKFPELKDLVKRHRFTEGDKTVILELQKKILGDIVSTYRAFQEDGKIEITTTPYFHPILPLLCDTQIARVAVPDLPLPKQRFSHPEDARSQLEGSVVHYQKHFGRPPRGLWPSEGSVSEETLQMAIEAGFQWAATDEEILLRTLKKTRDASLLYSPYQFGKGEGKIALLFRDRNLSDAIGFRYAGYPAHDAARDLLGQLRRIKEYFKHEKKPHVVGIILDGENAWEHYANDGNDFLHFLYEGISKDPMLKAVTVSEALTHFETLPSLSSIFPGSWIAGNFRIWIGHPEKNTAWEYLEKARKEILNFSGPEPARQEAQQSLYAAEGSDWNWWYGDDHDSSHKELFDQLFRNHLSHVYLSLGLEIPVHLKAPIRESSKSLSEPTKFFTPILDGRQTSYLEWLQAGHLDLSKQGGSMHRMESFLKHFYYGFNATSFFIRLDFDQTLLEKEKPLLIRLGWKEEAHEIEQEIQQGSFENPRFSTFRFSMGEIIEMGIGWEELEVKEGEELHFSISIVAEEFILERWPPYGSFRVKRPTPEFESTVWSV
ncbi:MAG: glycoside hydrolase [Candidatus Omnitrophica bacterium]|nr:glycoside hydrolase [Candidatus Omnitrophota bacterium]